MRRRYLPCTCGTDDMRWHEGGCGLPECGVCGDVMEIDDDGDPHCGHCEDVE